MRQKCTFCKEKDFKQTSPNLSVDLSKALESKAIPSTGVEIEHNELEKSSAIGMRIRDNFEAIEAQRQITALGKAQVAADKAAAAKAAESSTQTTSEGAN